MNQRREATFVIGMCWILGGLAAGTASAERGRSDSEAPVECCFKNSRYAGVCVVQPAEEETCASVLDYLNNPSSSGKSYCGFTEIRGGWKETSCQEETTSRRFSVPIQIPDRVGTGPSHDTASDQTHEEAYPECWN